MSQQNNYSDGTKYIPYDERVSNESIVYFTRDLSAAGLQKAYQKIAANLQGKIAIKLHTGEKHGPNIIPRPWVENLIQNELPDGTIIETNTFYEGDRYTTADHRETLEVNGWTFCPVDITDENATTTLPVANAKWISEISVGANTKKYDSMLTLTHFKGHAMGGFGGSNKNIGIGCADGRIGKGQIHQVEGQEDKWGIVEEELMERITESTKGTIDYFGKNVSYINVMRNMSVDCDCAGVGAEPVVTPNVGILASLDICAIDTACVDLIYAMKPEQNKALVERIETRHGHRQLSYMHEMGMGNSKYILIDLDHDEVRITPQEAVKDVVPFEQPKLINR